MKKVRWQRRDSIEIMDILNAPIIHGGDSIGVLKNAIVMRDDDHGAFGSFGDALKELHHDLTILGIERSGRLVTDDQTRLMHQCPRDGDTLLLPTGELIGPVFHSVSQTDPLKDLLRFLLCVSSRFPLDQQRHTDVLDAVQGGDQMELLENEPDVLSAESSDGGFLHRPQVRAEDFQFSFVRLQSASDDADERGLSAAGRTNEHGDVPTAHIEVDSFEDLKASTAVAEATFYTAKPSGQLVLRIGLANGNIGHERKGVNRGRPWLAPTEPRARCQ